MENKEFLLSELEKIHQWEEEQKDLWFWEKIGRIPFAVLDKITPNIVHEVLGKILDEIGGYIQTGGQYLISEENILTQLSVANASSDPLSLEDVASLPLQTMDRVAAKLKDSRTQFATMQGATTGFGGIFTLAIDIPALLGLSLKVLQEMALTYGYDPKEKNERIFVVKCLQFASSDFVGKQAILKDLSQFHTKNGERESISRLQGWREVIATYRDNYGWKKLFQLVPVIGILFGAWINRSTIEEVAEAGMMLYRKRRILDKLEEMEKNTQNG
ncbi:EcsC family protein [Lihuaxuella thermophila]|uniref:EcsC family protein n=1 Tax=Lihuaxuella thermophila TaxID=1173111 RepID=UPI000B7D7809